MSFPNDGQRGSGSGTNSNSTFNPALLNANAALANFNLNPSAAGGNSAMNPNLPPTVQQQISNFNPAQLARLTEFHRQIPQQSQQSSHTAQQSDAAATSSPAAVARPMVNPGAPLRSLSAMPQNVKEILASPNMSAEQRNEFLSRWLKTDEGKLVAQQHRQAAQAAQAAAASSAGAGGSGPANTMTGSPSSRPASFFPGQTPSGTLPVEGSSTLSNERRGSETQGYRPPLLPTARPPGASSLPTNRPPMPQSRPAPSGFFMAAPSVPPGWDGPARRPTSPEPTFVPRAPPAPRRREEGMRGTMRSELARLMYASGDVENPDLDTIDYMEDLVVDWLADLCAPPPPVRSHPSGPLVAPRLDYNVIRHRLSRPSMRKYLDRFEYMEYKAVDMRSARRVARGNFEPVDQKDLDRQLEKGFLDAEDSGRAGDGAGGGQARKKRKYTRQTDRQTGTAADADGSGAPKERKKPGPKKGWKVGLGDDKARKIKRARQSTGPSVSSGRGTSVKPEEQ